VQEPDSSVQPDPNGPDNHGIYANWTSGLIVRNNLIYENGERGIQFYPNSDNSTFYANILYRNYQNIDFDSDSSDNMVRNNILAFPRNYNDNVYAGPSASGTNNQINDNCAWQSDGTSGFMPGRSLIYSGNVVADALLENPGTLAMRVGNASECRTVYPIR
jgi:hypothetical protein